jgi:leucyl aminopeptidase (aminopeptidase T)
MMERYVLSIERMKEIPQENLIKEPFKGYFVKIADFILKMDELTQKIKDGSLKKYSFFELQQLNQSLYEDILKEAYETSYANPAYANKMLGEEFAPYLSFLYMEIRGMIRYAFEQRWEEMTICLEIFLEIYQIFVDGATIKEVKEALYYHVSDYCDVTVDYRVRENLDPSLTFVRDIVMNSNLEDLSYLYYYGEYIGKDELEVARYLNSLEEDTIELMANTYIDGYCKGFELAGIDLSKKPYVDVRFAIGFERVIKKAIARLENMGHQVICYLPAVTLMNKRPGIISGCQGVPANEQCEFDHRYDWGMFLDGALKERRLSVYRSAFEKYAKLAEGYAGPAVLETFGKETFTPVTKEECISLSEKQQKLLAQMFSEATRIMYEFINGEERSFTIISFPVPSIGEKFEEIFNETIRLNTLDYGKYREIQEKLIDALDKCCKVVVKGKECNTTNLTIELASLKNPAKESKFENCLADVNIPLGEVFTSPKLTGTNGTLHVGQVYIHGIQLKDLAIEIVDGHAVSYSCKNFDSEEENKKLIRSTVLGNYDTLPMGEFAIGTNTVAYRMAKEYDIFDKLDILIAEKTGPHFAFGDTCYSNSEERRIYNPNGKEIIAKDNEVSILRKESPEKAYFGCHTDVTLPYDELDSICGITDNGDTIYLVQNGKFVLQGTEELNRALDE